MPRIITTYISEVEIPEENPADLRWCPFQHPIRRLFFPAATKESNIMAEFAQ